MSKMAPNVLQLNFSLGFETVVYRNATNKAIILLDICKAKIIVFPEGTAFANAEKKARIDKKGLWKMNNPVPPWEFRKRKSQNI